MGKADFTREWRSQYICVCSFENAMKYINLFRRYGNPPGGDHDSFNVPIHMLRASVDAFLHLKGVSVLDPSLPFKCRFPGGVGCFVCGCYAEHIFMLGERHFVMERSTDNRRSATHWCSRTDYLCGLVDDICWLSVVKQGKSCKKLVNLLWQAFFAVLMFSIMIASATYATNCQSSLGLTQENWANMGDVGRADWCEQYTADDLLAKPGRPCICQELTTELPSVCNPALDPAAYESSEDDRSWYGGGGHWCAQWMNVDTSYWLVFSDEPCECLPFHERFQWRMIVLVDIIIMGLLSCSILYAWLLVTPIWMECGIVGIDSRQPGHIGSIRLDWREVKKLPRLVLEKKLGRPFGQLRQTGVSAADAKDGEHQVARWVYKPCFHQCTTGMREELALYYDYLHLHARSGRPACFCCCRHWLCTIINNIPVTQQDYYVLLRNVSFVETGTVFLSAKLKFVYGFLTIAALVALTGAAFLAASCGDRTNDSGCAVYLLTENILPTIGLASMCVILWLLGYCVLSRCLRRPYIHIGVPFGGGARGYANPFGGASPFYMFFKPSDVKRVEEMVALIRTAQAESRQADAMAALQGKDSHARRRTRLQTLTGNKLPKQGGTNMGEQLQLGNLDDAATVDFAAATRLEDIEVADVDSAAMACVSSGMRTAVGVDEVTLEAQKVGTDTNIRAKDIATSTLQDKAISDANAQLAQHGVAGIITTAQLGAQQARLGFGQALDIATPAWGNLQKYMKHFI
eukprot:SAG31_NODE_3082_length_4698_cov_1.855838_2_plen_745_part_00